MDDRNSHTSLPLWLMKQSRWIIHWFKLQKEFVKITVSFQNGKQIILHSFGLLFQSSSKTRCHIYHSFKPPSTNNAANAIIMKSWRKGLVGNRKRRLKVTISFFRNGSALWPFETYAVYSYRQSMDCFSYDLKDGTILLKMLQTSTTQWNFTMSSFLIVSMS